MANVTKSPGTAVRVDDGNNTTFAWSNPGNVVSSNDVYASCFANSWTNTTEYLKATNFGFAIPDGATIIGILVEIEKRKSGSDNGQDHSVVIVKSNGSYGSTDKKITGSHWPTTDTYFSYGGSTDTWGEVWTAADINSANFGVAISADGVADASAGITFYIDHIRITVFYTTSTSQPSFLLNFV